MKLFIAGFLASLALAAPTTDSELVKRQRLRGKNGASSSSSSSSAGNCGPAFIFARGSTENKPIGLLIGPPLKAALERLIPGIKTYPVLYAASLATNVQTARTDAKSTNLGIEAFQKAYNECPQRILLAGGYSQGAAVMGTAVPKLSREIQIRIAGVALFGNTLNKQNKGLIPSFPTDRAKTWCNRNDGVCDGNLVVNAGHLAYAASDISAAAQFLAGNAKKLAALDGKASE